MSVKRRYQLIAAHINQFTFARVVEPTDDHESEEGRLRWLELRKDFVGGSEAAAAMGLSRYQSKYELYLTKTAFPPSRADTEKMWAGRKLEPVIAEMFAERTGKHVIRQPFFYSHPVHSFMGANIDFGIYGENAGVECKNSTSSEFSGGHVPDEYFLQAMHYMAVTGAGCWYLAYLLYGWKFDYVEIQRDDALIELLIAGESDFWENHVIPQVPPEYTPPVAAEPKPRRSRRGGGQADV